jgi:hypothetical protein
MVIKMSTSCFTESLHAVTRCLASALLLVSLHACAGKAPVAAGGAEILCMDPRPEACTMQYDPVCATLADGSNATYANACGACGDAAVVSHRPGACE